MREYVQLKMKPSINQFRFYLLIVLFFPVSAIFAQQGVIKGKILDSKTKEPLIGAAILVVGTTNGVAADLDGNFVISNVKSGTHSLTASYVAYKTATKNGITVQNGQETEVEILLDSEDISLEAVEVVAKANRESENILLMEQKKALVATQTVGARELSRKGIGNAEAAVAKVSGVSKQEGVKNVFVRGLGDRYNATLLNGFPIPSEDPEYKNIALEFFGTDVIQNINISKVFSGYNIGDVGGAIIDISSKELLNSKAFGAEISGGLNTEVTGIDFLRLDGADYFGFSNATQPTKGTFDFPNSLDPSVVNLPMNYGFGLSGGKQFKLGENRNPLSFFIVGSHATNSSFTKETVRNMNTTGTIYQDQEGNKYSQDISQLILGNANYEIGNKHRLAYNFMMVHATNQYVGDYSGFHGEKYQDSETNMGFLRRQQINDNLLFTHQLLTDWTLTDKLKLDAGASYNSIKGLEPDRRENNFSQRSDGSYQLTGSNRQKRFFSELTEDDFNVKAALTYKLSDAFGSERSGISLGYNGRFVEDNFGATEYNFSAVTGTYSISDLLLDQAYNRENLENGKFRMTEGINKYHVVKYIHSGYIDGTYQLTKALTANLGVRIDHVNMTIDYDVQQVNPGEESIKKPFFLPNLNLKYDIDSKNVLRFGVSKTYTLPQSKEISPYQYVNIGFASQGNPNIKPSDNYNVDLKWDYYLSPSELFSLTGYFKHIIDPIGRIDEGNSAGLLTYDNISSSANVAGAELEVRKNILNRVNTEFDKTNRLSLGINASYIYTNLNLDIENTEVRSSRLEGASPFILNADISYNLIKKDRNLTASLVFNYFSDRIYTLGTRGNKDIIEKGLTTIDFVSSYKFNKSFGVKLKAANLLNPSYRLTREPAQNNDAVTLNEYKKGMNISLGLTYEL